MKRPEEEVSPPRAGAKGGFELSNVSVRSSGRAGRQHSFLVSQFSSPTASELLWNSKRIDFWQFLAITSSQFIAFLHILMSTVDIS